MGTIRKVCITCGEQFDCQSNYRRTQWCPRCMQGRRDFSREQHAISYSVTKKAKKNNELCEMCKVNPVETTHHIVSVYRGGKSSEGNLIKLCWPCHEAVHAKEGI